MSGCNGLIMAVGCKYCNLNREGNFYPILI